MQNVFEIYKGNRKDHFASHRKTKQGNNRKADQRSSRPFFYWFHLNFFEHELPEHFRQEEEIVFSLLADNDPKKTEVYAQHDILYGIIEKIKELPSEWQYLLTQFADQLDGHIRFEERELFPYIEQQTEQTVLQEAGKQIDALHKQHTAITWQDEFWIIKK